MCTLFLNGLLLFFFASYRLVIIHLYYIFSVINVNSCSVSTLEKSVSCYRFTNPLSDTTLFVLPTHHSFAYLWAKAPS